LLAATQYIADWLKNSACPSYAALFAEMLSLTNDERHPVIEQAAIAHASDVANAHLRWGALTLSVSKIAVV